MGFASSHTNNMSMSNLGVHTKHNLEIQGDNNATAVASSLNAVL
jgi:hypothetical protein